MISTISLPDSTVKNIPTIRGKAAPSNTVASRVHAAYTDASQAQSHKTDSTLVKQPQPKIGLHKAIRAGNTEAVKYLLLTSRINPMTKDRQGMTAFDHAHLSKNPQMIALVLGASIGKADIPQTALSGICNIQEVQMLRSEMGALKFPSLLMLNPIRSAAFLGQVDALQKAVEKECEGLGKSEADAKKAKILNEADQNGMPPLHYAAVAGKTDAVKWLLLNGAKPISGGLSALHMAVISGSSDIIRILLNQKMDPNAVDSRGRTPLHFALASDDLIAARLLVEKGANPLVQTSMQTTPFSLIHALTEARAAMSDPLRLDTSSLLTFGAYVTGAAVAYATGYNVPLNAAPILAKTLALPFPISSFVFPSAFGAYGMQSPLTRMGFEGLHTAMLGKTLFDNLRPCWENIGHDPYRSLRNAAVHTANFLFSGWELLKSSGLKKPLVCAIGGTEQCLAQEDLNPVSNQPISALSKNQITPRCTGQKLPKESIDQCVVRIKPINPDDSPDQLTMTCKGRQQPNETTDQCVARIYPEVAREVMESQKVARKDAELILKQGGLIQNEEGYSKETLDQAAQNLRDKFKCELETKCTGTGPVSSKIEDAYNTLLTPLPKDPCSFDPAALAKLTPEDRILVLNPQCPVSKFQAKMVLGCENEKEDLPICKKKYKALSQQYHPDKQKCNLGSEKCAAVLWQINSAWERILGRASSIIEELSVL